MTENKTRPTADSVSDFIEAIVHEKRRADSRELATLMQKVTGVAPVMWGSIVGFGKYHYKYATGREGDTVAVGFSPRKQALSLYGVIFYEQNAGKLKDLGEYETGKGCLYIKDLDKIDKKVLGDMIATSFAKNNNADFTD